MDSLLINCEKPYNYIKQNILLEEIHKKVLLKSFF